MANETQGKVVVAHNREIESLKEKLSELVEVKESSTTK